MANVRAPNIDFTLGTPGNQIPMSNPVSPVADVIIIPSAFDPVASPQCSAMCSGGGGGGGSTNGFGYATT